MENRNITPRGRINELLSTPRMYYATFNQDYNQLKGLKMLIDDFVNPQFCIVEIGSFSGVSSELFAIHCKKLYCVDLWDPYWEIKHDSVMGTAENRFDEMSSRYPNITKIKKSSEEASKDFDDHSLDLVYIDAAHDYESVKNDIFHWMKKVKKGGYIAGHDYRYDRNIGVYQAVNEIFGSDYKIVKYPDSSFIIQL